MTTKATRLPALPSLPKSRTISACECGCGGRTASRFVPGHDSKQKAYRLRVEAGVFDKDAPDSSEAQLDGLADLMGDSIAQATARHMGIEWTPKAEREAAEKAEKTA